jgi:localization factor PodJL
MNARTSSSAKTGPGSTERHDKPTGSESDLVFDDLLDARFDAQGRLSQVGRGSRQRIAERLDPRPPTASAKELERAVQKLSEGLAAIERQSRPPHRRQARAPGKQDHAETDGGRDFVTYSLNRLEARLEALSQRLQSRAATADAAPQAEAESESSSGDPSLAVEPDYDAESAELRRMAELEAERLQRQAEERRREAAAEEARRETEAEALRRAEAEEAEAQRRAEAEEAEAQRRAEAEEAEARRAEEEEAEARRRAEEEEAALRRAQEEAAEARRLAEEAEAEARRHAEAAEEERLARLAEARRQAESAAATQRQFAEIEARLEALQRSCDENQVAPVRAELIELLREIEDITRDRNDVAEVLQQIGARLGEMEVKVNAARNMAGNRLGDIQDRLAGLTERLDEVEVEIPGYDAIRENQSAILERFDRMEGLVHHLASPEELLDRVDGLRHHIQSVASQQEVTRIEERILGLADRLDALPETLSDADALAAIEAQLASLASELTTAQRQRMEAASDLDQHLSGLAAKLEEVGESGRAPDLSNLEEGIAALGVRFDEDRHRNTESLARLEQRLAGLATAVEEQENDAAAEILAGLTRKIDVLAEAIEAQDSRGARRDIEALGDKLDQLAHQLADQAEHLSRAQAQPLEARLDQMQRQIEELAKASSDQLRPFVQKLQEISDRVSALGAAEEHTPLSLRLEAIEERLAGLGNGGRGPDPRALQTQLEGIVSRLELLKGRSIDPARLNELFDRVDSAIRALPEERFARLERKLEEIGGAPLAGGEALVQDELAELRSDIVALRRELRSLPVVGAGEDEGSLADLLQSIAARLDRLPEDVPATAAALEAQVDRIAALLDDPSHARLALVHIETSLKAIEQRLEETRGALTDRAHGEDEAAAGDFEAVAGAARALSDDVTVLKDSTEASEKQTKQALDAVQDTLEAVVKRMAFLERDAEKGGAGPEDVVEAARQPEETSAETEAEPAAVETQAEPEPAETDAVAAPASEPEQPVEAAEAVERPESAPADVIEPPAIEPAPEPPRSEPRSGGGLLSRFTSRQLLRRATGGRAESFTPEPEESEDESDFPIEPGTDSPLSSALTGAPSSDTEFMSGGRKSRKGRPLSAEDETGYTASIEPDAEVDEDFLAAARRAARSAADTAGGEGAASRRSGGLRSRRTALLAAALAVAVAFAAVQIVRNQILPRNAEVASATATPASDASGASAPVASSETMQANTSTSSGPSISDGGQTQTADSGGTTDDTGPAITASTDTATTGTVSTPPAAATTPMAPATEGAPGAVASLGPTDESAAPTADSTSASTAAPQPQLPEPPLAIGSQRLRDAALAGDPAAAFEVAARYAEGRVVSQDLATAAAWYHRAAEAGLAPAQYRLGSIYEKGLGVPKDLAAAQDWYGRAARAGNVKAMHNLAVLYAEGAGGEPDLERAAVLFRQAAEHGVRDSQFNLAILYARGLGVPQDLVKAYKWFSVAASSGDEESAKRRDIIAAALSEDDLAKAQAAAAVFEPLPLISEANEVIMPEGGWGDRKDSTSVEVQSDEAEADLGSNLSENDLVALVQKLLADQGFDPGPADGLLGRQTIQAIVDFQSNAGLPATGQIDPELVEALKQAAG